MRYVYKLPILLSIVFAIITAIASLINGKDVSAMAYDVCIVIVLAYLAGIIIKSIIIKTVKEVLVKQYILEQQEKMKKKKNNKEEKSESEFEIKI
ncbi:MAG: hypothetical protein ACM3KR_03825 [Deltaproteobacteria bacterium]